MCLACRWTFTMLSPWGAYIPEGGNGGGRQTRHSINHAMNNKNVEKERVSVSDDREMPLSVWWSGVRQDWGCDSWAKTKRRWEGKTEGNAEWDLGTIQAVVTTGMCMYVQIAVKVHVVEVKQHWEWRKPCVVHGRAWVLLWGDGQPLLGVRWATLLDHVGQ